MAQYGRIVNIARSTAVNNIRSPVPAKSASTASQRRRQEGARAVTVNAIAPGYIDTTWRGVPEMLGKSSQKSRLKARQADEIYEPSASLTRTPGSSPVNPSVNGGHTWLMNQLGHIFTQKCYIGYYAPPRRRS
jgi:NAD(P)-dependent dehydrogenase (short-subunit alcohol dehydrogenase family)